MQNLLKVRIKNEVYGFDAEKIEQILLPPNITPIPLTKEYILGITPIGGKIFYVFDLCKMLYNENVNFTSNTKLLTDFDKNGFIVDEVLEMIEIDNKNLEESENELLVGIYKENEEIIQVLDINKILMKDSLTYFKPKALVHINNKDKNNSNYENYRRVLFFKVNNEKFAIDIEILREIIYPPEITSIAKTDILGVITLRGEAINVLSVNELLGFKNKEIDEKSRILIASNQKSVIGLLVDDVDAVRNIEISQIEKLPNNDEIVESVYKKEMVTLISSSYIKRLIDDYCIEDEDIKEENKESNVSEVVIFKIEDEEYAFDIDEVQEIIKFEEITPVPNMPEIVEGILNLRGNMIPIISLAKKFNLKENISEQTKIIVCNVDNEKIGFVVDDVSEILFIEDKYISKAESENAIFDEVINLDERIILKIKVNNLLDKELLEKIKIGVDSGKEGIDS